MKEIKNQCHVMSSFGLSVGMVRAQESALAHKEADAMICGSAIASYVYMHDCWVLIELALSDILKDNKDGEIPEKTRRIKRVYRDLARRFEELRHNLGGHPAGDKPGTDIGTKRTMTSSDGRVKIGKFLLHPRKDLEDLRTFLDRIGNLLHEKWKV